METIEKEGGRGEGGSTWKIEVELGELKEQMKEQMNNRGSEVEVQIDREGDADLKVEMESEIAQCRRTYQYENENENGNENDIPTTTVRITFFMIRISYKY